MASVVLHLRRPSSRSRRSAFTLIELLVVIAIVATLIAILLPSLRQARATTRLTVCGSNLAQLGRAIHTYANDNRGRLPCGPPLVHPFDFSAYHIATNQLWTGGEAGPYPPANPHCYNGYGVLLPETLLDAKVFFCPADDTYNLARELPKLRTDAPAYGSYIARQLDHLPSSSAGLLDHLGENQIGDVRVRVETLALDTNSLGEGPNWHTNHNAFRVNVLFRDGAVRCYHNSDNCLAIPPTAFPAPTSILAALDQLLTNTDYAYRTGRPAAGPRLDVEP